MSKVIGQLKAILGLDKTKYDRGLNDAEKKTSKFSSGLKKMAGVMAAAFSVAVIIKWGKALVNAFRIQSEAELKLRTIMKQRMGLGQEAVNSLKEQAKQYQKIGVVGDEVQLSGLQQLATFLKQKQSLQALLPAMNNLLAQQKGVNATAEDAVGIANMMGKVLDGQVASLRRIGISFTEAQNQALKTGNEYERAAMLAQVITDNVGNMNEEMGRTDLGNIQRWKNAWGDIKETLGEQILPMLSKAAELMTKIFGGPVSEQVNDPYELWRNVTKEQAKDLKRQAEERIKYLQEEGNAINGAANEIKFLTEGLAILDAQITKVNEGSGIYIRSIAELEKEIADYNEELKSLSINDQQGIKALQEKIRLTQQYLALILAGKAYQPGTVKAPGKVTVPGQIGWLTPSFSEGVNIPEGLAKGPEAMIQQTNEMTKALQAQDTAVAILAGGFDALFTGGEDGFKNMIDSMIKDFLRLIAQVAAKAAILGLIQVLFPGSSMAIGAFQGLQGMFNFGGIPKGASGGTVPPGFHGDTYPALLSTGETVLTPDQSAWMHSGKLDIEVHGTWLGRELSIGGRRTSRFN